jgi:hypothetical protein
MAHGNGANGAAHEPPACIPITMVPTDDHNPPGSISSERFEKIRDRLNEPFDPIEIKWRVTATSTRQAKHGPQKRGQLVAYADQRAYTDRLNEVFGEWGWTRSYDVQVAQNFERRTPGEKTRTTVSAKVVVVSKVTVHGLGSHTGMGEEWAHDENAATRAEAQAFKRACTCFGLGRYLYDLGAVWVDLDPYNRPVETPVLPEWALPGDVKRETQRQKSHAQQPSSQNVARDALLANIQELRQKTGRSLSGFVIDKYGGGTELEECDEQQLTTFLQKLTDIGNGIDRLRRAGAAVGNSRYAVICRELNLAGDSIDDIPNREALRHLLERVEAEAAGKNGNGVHSTRSIGDARGRLLQAAREIAAKTGKRLADIIAEASEGRLSLEGLRDLADADVPLVLAATSRLSNGGDR